MNYNKIKRVKYQPTKTDIKGIKRWLRRNDDQKQFRCPFQVYRFRSNNLILNTNPHWKCYNIFGKKIGIYSSYDSKLIYIECPCVKIPVATIVMNAQRIIKQWKKSLI
jgi:hypothetical protein